MTVDEVQKRVRGIKARAQDKQVDGPTVTLLFSEVLRVVASSSVGHTTCKQLSAEALKVYE